jgi:hypothetical protein
MSLEEKLRRNARAVTGDEAIFDVAELHPRGFSAAAGAGAGIGSAAGEGLTDSSIGSMLGGVGGAAAGMAAAAAARDLPLRICVAVSPTRVYLLEIRDKVGFDDLAAFAEIERSAVRAEAHGRGFNRVVTVRDTASGKDYEMEARRLGPFKAKDIVKLLATTHDPVAPADEETTTP